MTLIEKLISYDALRSVATARIDESNVFFENGGVPAWAGLEYMAQAIAAHAGFAARLRGERRLRRPLPRRTPGGWILARHARVRELRRKLSRRNVALDQRRAGSRRSWICALQLLHRNRSCRRDGGSDRVSAFVRKRSER